MKFCRFGLEGRVLYVSFIYSTAGYNEKRGMCSLHSPLHPKVKKQEDFSKKYFHVLQIELSVFLIISPLLKPQTWCPSVEEWEDRIWREQNGLKTGHCVMVVGVPVLKTPCKQKTRATGKGLNSLSRTLNNAGSIHFTYHLQVGFAVSH